MKKVVFCCALLLSISATQAQGLKGKFMLSVKGGPVYLHEEYTTRPTIIGSCIDYFVADQILVGLEMNYMEYDENGPITEIQTHEADSELGTKWRWYSVVFSGKLALDATRFSPFVKAGFGLYIPRLIYHLYPDFYDSTPPTTIKVYGRTCPGYNLGMGLQYRVWKGLGLQLEGNIDHIINRARQINSARSFTFANINGGLSIIF